MTKTKPTSAIFAKLFPSPLRKGERAKLLIVDAAVKILGHQGIEGLGYESIGKELDLPRAQVRYHFPDKTELVKKALEFAFLPMEGILMERLPQAKTWVEQILALNDTLFDFLERHPAEARVWVYAHTAAALHAEHRRTMRDALASGERRVTAILEQHPNRKWKRGELSQMSLSVWSIIDMFSVYAISLQPADTSQYRKAARYALLNLLGQH